MNALQRTMGVPTFLLRVLNANAEMMAPALPAAAEIPWANARKRVGKTDRNSTLVKLKKPRKEERTFGRVTIGCAKNKAA